MFTRSTLEAEEEEEEGIRIQEEEELHIQEEEGEVLRMMEQLHQRNELGRGWPLGQEGGAPTWRSSGTA
jgi:hypothetical protein